MDELISAGRIVIIDDTAVARLRLQHFLESHGFSTKAFAEASEALEYLLNHPEEVDIMLTDLLMPQMDGFNLIEEVKSHAILRRINIIVITGLNDEVSLARARQLGAFACLVKPFDELDVLQLIKKSFMRNQFRILVVDDSDSVRELLFITLIAEGFSVEVTADGTEAMSLIRKNKYNLIITDIDMPEMDGFGLVTKMREEGFELPVVFLTSHYQLKHVLKARKYKVIEYIKKPFTRDNFLLRIRQIYDNIQES